MKRDGRGLVCGSGSRCGRRHNLRRHTRPLRAEAGCACGRRAVLHGEASRRLHLSCRQIRKKAGAEENTERGAQGAAQRN